MWHRALRVTRRLLNMPQSTVHAPSAADSFLLIRLLWFVICSKAAKSVRHKLPHQAVSTLAQMVVRDKRMADDMSIIIVDMLPPPAPGIMPQQFPASALKVRHADRMQIGCI
jgi:hypothetical protein